MKPSQGLVIASLGLAAVAFALPWVTHFADGGISFLAHAAWAVIATLAFVKHGRHALLALIGVPFALFWPGVLVWVVATGSLRLSF
jgi:hypothetical protein